MSDMQENSFYDVLTLVADKEIKVLDHGFVSLVDCMPRIVPVEKTADFAIVQAARVSYGDGTKKSSEDRGLIRYLMRHTHCYDAETEVLTEFGFVKWSELQSNCKLGIFDPIADSLMYEIPEYLTCDHYSGLMYGVDHGGVNLLVTPNHNMYVKTKMWSSEKRNMVWENDYRLVKAKELGNRSMVRYSKIAPFKSGEEFSPTHHGFPNVAADTLLALIGFFIGDGSISHTCENQISFHLLKTKKIKYLRYLCQRLGWELRELEGNTYTVAFDGISNIFRQFYKNENKYVPSFLLSLNEMDAKSLLVGLKNSDGSIKHGVWEYSTNVEQVAESIQKIALHAGEAANICKKDTDIYCVSIMSKTRYPVINQTNVNTFEKMYEGNVYCAKTRTGILVVRRNGKIVLSGNSTPSEMVEFKFHCKMPLFIARQWLRHRTANVNEISARYSIMKDEFYFPTIDGIRSQSKTNKQGGEESIDSQISGDYLIALDEICISAYQNYEKYIEEGVSREQARMILPVNLYTEMYWKIDLHNLLHFLSLRCDSHAQLEIRVFADAILKLISPLVPFSIEAWNDYHFRRDAILLTRLEIDALRNLLAANNINFNSMIQIDSENKREQEEWKEKFAKLIVS